MRAMLIASLVACCGDSGAQQRPAQPNILVLLADDLGWGDVGFHHATLPTPQLDRLAKEGVELQRFYAYPV